jgi:acylglycerol lipase
MASGAADYSGLQNASCFVRHTPIEELARSVYNRASMLDCDQIVVHATDGTRLEGCLWQHSAPPRALVWLSHGYAEHIGRYAHVVEPLVEAGFSVAGLDHRGHGRSDGRRALTPHFDVLVADFRTFVQAVDSRVPAAPRFMLAHSMGAVIGLHYTMANQSELAGLVLSGAAVRLSGVDFEAIRPYLAFLARTVPRLGVRSIDPDILTRDPQAVERFKCDQQCYHGRVQAGTAYHLPLAGADALEHARELTLPLLVMYGTADTLADPDGSVRLHHRARSADKMLEPWQDFRHEIFNELGKERVISTTTAWLERHSA